MIRTITFDKPTYRDSYGRNRFTQTCGVEIWEQTSPDPDRSDCVVLNPITTRGQASEACRLSIARSAIPELITALREIQNTIQRDFDDVSNTDRFYLRRIYDLIGQGSLERLTEEIEGYQFEDPTATEGFFNLEAEIYRRDPNK